jgi:ectoine hydroxylase-related dioxygenase (phytanoyl-CoA dioxygenase family)
MLVGIILSDVSEEFCGSLTVYPKSHHVTEKYFNEVGIDTVKENGLSSFKTLPLCKPVQVTGKAGDVVFAHYNLAHTVAPNCSADFRYAIYFRINVRERPGCQEPLMNIWLDFPGLSDIVQQEAKNKEQLIREATSGA